jgi:Effector-associated domain 1
VLAEMYPDLEAARSIWVRAGGKRSEIENIAHPRDLWQRFWLKSLQGAAVRPAVLLRTVLTEAPNNTVIAHYLSLWQ